MALLEGSGMLRFLVVAIMAVFATQLSSVARASTVQYDLTLTPTTGSIAGTGYFDVSAPVSGSGVIDLTALSITIDGQTFNQDTEIGTATATFANGVLEGVNYVGALLSGLNLDLLGTDDLTYTFLDIGTGAALSTGTISAVDPPPTTPLPGAMVLFATGLIGLLLLNYRRKKSALLPV
jgi:hypothetical protein